MSLAAMELEHCLRLVREGGAGWHPYTLDKADRLAAADPQEYRGLVAAVESEVGKAGAQAVDAARRAAKWMVGK